MKKLWIFLALMFIVMQIEAQNLSDAIRYSSLINGGTARTMGTGGSFGAMGGDFGVLTINPAGIADFRKSDLSFSFSFNGGQTSSILNNNRTPFDTQHTNEPILENIGVVFTSQPKGGSLVTNNLAIGLNQYNNFRQNFWYEGLTTGSITERFAELANNISPNFLDPFEATLAYEAGAIYDFDNDLVYETDLEGVDEVFKQQSVSRSGKINEFVIAWAGKFNNNFNLGIGIGVPFISFEENKIYEELDNDMAIETFERLIYSEELSTSGTGFNVKIGMGYTIAKTIRLGLSYQSPTNFKLDDNYENNLLYSYRDDSGVQTFESRSPTGVFEYELTTPSRLTGSIGALINTSTLKGFFNLDVQLVNYNKNRFNLSDNSANAGDVAYERVINSDIDFQLQSAMNINLGGELVFDKFRARAGLGLLGSPYAVDGTKFNNLISLGGGFRGERFYIDVAYQIRNFSEGYTPYSLLDENREQLVVNDTDISKVIFTVGFKI